MEVGAVNFVVRNVGRVAVTRARPLAFPVRAAIPIAQLKKSIAASIGACGE